MNARPLFFLAAAALASLAVACGSSVDTQTSTSSSTSVTGGGGSGGNDNPCWPDSCTGPSQTVGTSATSGTGGNNPCYPDSCTGPSTTGVGGSGGGIPSYPAILVNAGQVPLGNSPGGAQPTDILLEAFIVNATPVACSDASTETFGCSRQGLSVVVPAGLPVGDYDLATMNGFFFQWLGDCSDGGGGTAHIANGTLSIYTSDASGVFGVVNDLSDSNGALIQSAFSFDAPNCPMTF